MGFGLDLVGLEHFEHSYRSNPGFPIGYPLFIGLAALASRAHVLLIVLAAQHLFTWAVQAWLLWLLRARVWLVGLAAALLVLIPEFHVFPQVVMSEARATPLHLLFVIALVCSTGAARSVNAPAAAPPADAERVMLLRPRKSRIYFMRRFFDYPITPSLDTLVNLGPRKTLRIGLSYARAVLRSIRNETTLEEFFINRFGRELYNTFLPSYTEKVWGVPCSQSCASANHARRAEPAGSQERHPDFLRAPVPEADAPGSGRIQDPTKPSGMPPRASRLSRKGIRRPARGQQNSLGDQLIKRARRRVQVSRVFAGAA